MSDLSDHLSQMRAKALLNLVLWILLIFFSFKLFGRYGCFVLASVVGVGMWFAGQNLMRMIRISQVQHDQLRDFQQEFQQQFARTTLPRQVFLLLLAVAEADGRPSQKERELVREFVMQRFTSPVDVHDLSNWEATARVPPEQVGSIALNLRRILTESECETLFSWCCFVAFVDDSFQPEEHIALQDIARGLGIERPHARRLFHHAKHAHMHGHTDSSAGSGGRGDGRGRARGMVNERGEALAVLGLEEGASDSDIRGRHRELVKKYHPDRHIHLGPVAAKEAEERFREVQSAYEVLTG